MRAVLCMVVLQLAGSCNQLWLGAQLLLVGAVLTLAQRRRHEILPQLLSRECWPLQRCWGADGGVRHPAAGIPDLG